MWAKNCTEALSPFNTSPTLLWKDDVLFQQVFLFLFHQLSQAGGGVGREGFWKVLELETGSVYVLDLLWILLLSRNQTRSAVLRNFRPFLRSRALHFRLGHWIAQPELFLLHGKHLELGDLGHFRKLVVEEIDVVFVVLRGASLAETQAGREIQRHHRRVGFVLKGESAPVQFLGHIYQDHPVIEVPLLLGDSTLQRLFFREENPILVGYLYTNSSSSFWLFSIFWKRMFQK